MKKCVLLDEYSEFVYTVRTGIGRDGDTETQAGAAIDHCINNNILSRYLRERRSEVLGSLIRDFDKEKYERGLREEGREEGLAVGREEGREEGKIQMLDELLKEGIISPEQAEEMKKKVFDGTNFKG